MNSEVVPEGVLDAGELKRVLREVRREDAVLAPEGSNPDLTIAIIERSLALRAPAVFGTALWVGYGGSSPTGPTTTRRVSRPPGWWPRSSGAPGLRTAGRRRREDRPRGEPQDGGAARPHRAAQDPAPRRRLPAMTGSTPARAALPQVRRRPAGAGRRRADGVEPGRALLLLPGDPARDRPGRAREGGGGRGAHRAVPERGRAAGARDDPDRVRRSRRQPGGAGQTGIPRRPGAALAEQRELDFLRVLRNVPAVSELSHLDLSGKEQLRVSRLEPDVVGSQEDFSRAPKFVEARAGKTYWSPVYLRNESEPYVTLAVPVGKYAVEVTTAEVSLGAVLKMVSQIEVGAAAMPTWWIRATTWSPTRTAGCSGEARFLRARPGQVRAGRARGRRHGAPRAVVADGLGAAQSSRPTRQSPRSGGWCSSSGRLPTPTRRCAPRSSGAWYLRAGSGAFGPGEHPPGPAHGRADPGAPGRGGAHRRRRPRPSHRGPHRRRAEALGEEFNGRRGSSRSRTPTSSKGGGANPGADRAHGGAGPAERALGEVGQAVSSTLDLETVLTTIVGLARTSLPAPTRAPSTSTTSRPRSS